MRVDEHDVYEIPGPPRSLPAPAPAVIEALAPVVTEARLARIREVAAQRLTSVAPVLEELTDPHNASAILRSADGFGVQRIHAIPGDHGLVAAHRVARGAHRWLDVFRHHDAAACARSLRTEGYELVVAAAGGRLKPEDLARRQRVAIVFGNEHRGASERMTALADDTYEVPMVGFTESLNVSVAAAVTLYAATRGRHGELDPDARHELIARFLMSSVRDAQRLVDEYVRGRPGASG